MMMGIIQCQQQSKPCPPETVNPVCTITPFGLECIQPRENMSSEPDKGLTNQTKHLSEREDSYV